VKSKKVPAIEKNQPVKPFQNTETSGNINTPMNYELQDLLSKLQKENQYLREHNAILEQRDTRFQLIALNSPDTILFQNCDLIYVWVINSTPLIGVEQVVGKTDFELLSSSEAKRAVEIKRQLLLNGQNHYEEITSKTDERIHSFSLLYQPWRDASGKFVGIATYMRDITDQKKAGEELKEQLEGEKLVAEIASQFIVAENTRIEEQIPAALQKMAEYLKADLGFIRFIEPINNTVQKGFEWKNPSNQTLKTVSAGTPLENFQFMKKYLDADLPLYISEVDQITKEGEPEKDFLRKAGLESLVFHPIYIFGVLTGYVGFGAEKSHPFWSEREKGLLELFRSTIVNVLERRENENALRESQELYQKLVELSPNFIFLFQENKLQYVNPSGAQLLGFVGPEEIIGKPYEVIFPPEVILEFQEKVKNTWEENRIITFELSMKLSNRNKLSVEISSLPVKIHGKQAYLSVGVDITQRKLFEAEIEGNRQFLNDILNISPLGIYVIDHQREKFTYFNNATGEILGFSPDHFKNLNQKEIFQNVYFEDQKKAISMSEKLTHLPVGRVSEGEYRWVKPDGEICWLHSFQTAISRNPDGTTLQSLTIVQDVTNIKKAQFELKKSEDSYRGLVENIPGMVYQALLEEPFTTVFISDYFEKLTSFSKKDVLKNGLISWMGLVHPDDMQKLSSEIHKFTETSDPFSSEYRVRTANGEYIWVNDSGRIITDENNKPLFLNGLITDISARKRDYEAMRQLSQDNLRLLSQARRDSETKTLLLNEVNHRVKNNIASIIGLLDMEGKREINSSADFRTALSDIKNRINGLAIVHDILSSNQWAPVQLEFFIRKVIENASVSSPIGRNVEINIYAQDKNIWINPRQATALALILNELTTNAIRHAFSNREKGTLTITIRKEAKNSTRVHISFADDGPGWPDEILEGKGGNVGMQVIRLSAISPLYGEIKFENHNGAVATISFNLASQRELPKPLADSKST
jgi:PAS domain S-box-containing protein